MDVIKSSQLQIIQTSNYIINIYLITHTYILPLQTHQKKNYIQHEAEALHESYGGGRRLAGVTGDCGRPAGDVLHLENATLPRVRQLDLAASKQLLRSHARDSAQ